MKHISTILAFFFCSIIFAQDLANPAVIGQPNRNQKTGNGLQVQDTFIAKNVVHLPGIPTISDLDTVVGQKNGQIQKIATADLFALSDSQYVQRTYTNLYNEWNNKNLLPGRQYEMTDQRQIYDQSISDIVKTAAVEPIVLTATSDSTFSPMVTSLYYPEDVIYYDISVNTTYINAAAAKGKIYFRADKKGNQAPFDFRHILMYRASDASEALAFDADAGMNVLNSGLFPPESFTKTVAGFEFPSVIIQGSSLKNGGNLIASSYFDDGLEQSTGNTIFDCSFGKSATQIANNLLDGCTFDSTVAQMINIDATTCTFADQCNYCTTGSWAETDFGEQVNKCIGTNFYQCTIDGRIDRIFNGGILTSNFGGRLYWCNVLFVADSDIDGDFSSGNLLSWTSTDINCKMSNIRGMGNHGETSGFKNCLIVGNSASSTFGYIDVQCIVDGKTIDEATYPELFDVSYPKIIYTTPNGNVWYRWLDDSNVWQFTQIL